MPLIAFVVESQCTIVLDAEWVECDTYTYLLTYLLTYSTVQSPS